MPGAPRPEREADEELRTFFEMSTTMLCIAGFNGYFTRLNPAWTATLGHTMEELRAEPYVDFVHPDDRARTIEEAARLRIGMETISFENRYRCKDGSYKWLLWRAHANFETNQIFAAARDITDRKQTEDALRSAVAELGRSNEELAQFAYIASHDLQEPLRMVASFLQLIDKRYTTLLDDEGKKYIRFAVDGAKRMQTLIHALLSLSRIQTRARPAELTDCAKVFRSVITDHQLAIAEADATVTCDALPTLMADSVQIAQLFQNLLGNALKFRSKDPVRIHFGATRISDAWQFSISDNGIGFEPQFYDRVFGIFQRLRSGDDLPGTGIGLAICKKIVERHGGRIWVTSEPGRGSTFFFTIPDNKPPNLG
jgi:PAS domain S-box-containing protein